MSYTNNNLPPGHSIPLYLGVGFCRYIDHLGSDTRIVETARVSYGSPSKGPEADKKLLNYLYKHNHSSPFECCNITFNIRMPIFIMRQFVRHRTFRLNEVSARYTELPDDFFLPEVWRQQDSVNKQGSIEVLDNDIWNLVNTQIAENVYKVAYDGYKQMIANGVAKEQARIVLPVGIFTEINVNCDIRSLMNFLRLRLDSHAQKEAQELAQAMFDIMKDKFPWCSEAFRRYKHVIEEVDLENV